MENRTSVVSRWTFEIKDDQRRCVFLADGSQYDVKLLRGVLECDGWQTAIAVNGCNADSIREMTPDMVVIDTMLPEIDARKVCRDIRLQSRIPILVFGPRPKKEKLVAYLEAGADDYINMPLNPAELLARVRALIRLCRAYGN